MGLGDDVKQIVSDVGGTVAGIAGDAAKQVAKTPLDILEEILGGKPGSDAGGKQGAEGAEKVEPNAGSQDSAGQQAALQQKMADDQQTTSKKLQAHRAFMAQQDQVYQQQTAQEEQAKKVEQQEAKQKEQYNIEQLKHERQNYQVQAAKDASNAEKNRNLGAG